jgi:hypothetical protein
MTASAATLAWLSWRRVAHDLLVDGASSPAGAVDHFDADPTPNFMNGVTALPLSMVSRTGAAMQARRPRHRDWPPARPTMVPASRCRVLAHERSAGRNRR